MESNKIILQCVYSQTDHILSCVDKSGYFVGEVMGANKLYPYCWNNSTRDGSDMMDWDQWNTRIQPIDPFPNDAGGVIIPQ